MTFPRCIPIARCDSNACMAAAFCSGDRLGLFLIRSIIAEGGGGVWFSGAAGLQPNKGRPRLRSVVMAIEKRMERLDMISYPESFSRTFVWRSHQGVGTGIRPGM